MGEHSVCVGAQKENAVGGISQSSNSVLLRGDRLCVIERERQRKKRRRQKQSVSSDFTAPIIALTQASSEACHSHGIHTVLTTYSEVPHYSGFIKMSVNVCGPHGSYCI